MTRPTRLVSRLLTGSGCLLALCIMLGAAHAGPYEVRKGDTLKSFAAANNISVKDLTQANKLPSGARLKPGQIIQVPDAPALPRPDITIPGENLNSLTGQNAQGGQGYSKIEPPKPAASGKPSKRGVTVAPEFRPAVDAVTPKTDVQKEPKTYDRSAPGVSAVIHQDDKTEIRGVVNLPGGQKQPGQPDREASSPSAGVLLRRSF
ncbi:LysM peptidoglycan-binding domain-containing protein [Fundidesulfovibrio soli]|uniref:LysM peptidoglycan-binding domain-containing protein n=1 Tax=Fundidesulfovibrio soli TaxID=2922716 RepID=UPI001FAF2013|nr:LysM peptidoglycan-binding domain-containing protein [Fundidesulfovibrio soli]